jgi:type II secretory pathway pseudopilin PulG
MRYSQTRQKQHRHIVRCAALIAMICLVASAGTAQNASVAQSPDVPFFQELNKYPGLLEEFGRLIWKLQHNVQFPPARTESHLLPLLPESTTLYAAFSNYGDVTHQALNVFQQELQESTVLRDWWQHSEMAKSGPKVESALEKIYQLSQYLGDEIVVSGSLEGQNPSMMIAAEIRKPGLKVALEEMLNESGNKSKASARVLDLQELAKAEESPSGEPLVLVRPDFVVVAFKVAALRSFSAQMDRGSKTFASTAFGQRIVQEYDGGATVVGGADLQKLLQQIPTGTEQEQMTFERTGFTDVKYLVWGHKKVAGQAISEAELSFTGPRRGMAAWLATPSPLGSLDFVSPKAMLAIALVLTSPAQIFEDVKLTAGNSNSGPFATLAQFEKLLNLSLKDDVLSHLGGEITAELDDIAAPKPVWKVILRIDDSNHLQQTLNTLLAVAHLVPEQVTDGKVTYYTIHVPRANAPVNIGYAFADGYWIVASSQETVAEAVRLHKTGESLGKSKKFLASLPPSPTPGASALLYQDPQAMAALQMQRLGRDMAESLAHFSGQTTPTVLCAYGAEKAIREASKSAGFDVGAILVVAAIAIPNLLRSRMAANEASAVGTIRTVNTAQITYRATFPPRGFAPDLATLGPDPSGKNTSSADHANMIDAILGGAACTANSWCIKSGFRFSLASVCKEKLCDDFVVVGTPTADNTGTRSFCSTSDGVIRYKTGAPVTSPVSVSECRTWTPLQ